MWILISDGVVAKHGMSILIHGAAGGVGSYASQITRNLGARVIGPARWIAESEFILPLLHTSGKSYPASTAVAVAYPQF